MTNEIDHVIMRIEDLEEPVDWYKSHFGYVENRDRTQGETFTNVFLTGKQTTRYSIS
jgi:lactoylglutathione lyase